MRRYISFVLVIIMTLLAGCNKSEEVDKIITPYEKIDFMDEVMDIRTFTVSDKGELFIIKGGVLTRYTHDGTFIKEYADTMDFTSLCYGEIFYAYDAVKSKIVSLNLEDGKIQEVSNQIVVDEVLKLVEIDGDLYMLAVPDAHGNAEPGPGGYIDFGETLYRIDLKTGKVKDIGENNIIAIYGSSDGSLYYYAYRDDTYSLFSYDTKNGKSKKLYDMNNVGYVSAFVYEKDQFICSAMTTIKYIRPSDGMEQEIEADLFILSGNDMNFLHGNVVYYGLHTDSKPSTINSFYLEDISFEEENEDATTESPKKLENSIVISTAFRSYIYPSAVKNVSGINTFMVDQSSFGEVLLTEIMAGNPLIDIYIIPVGSEVAAGLSEKGIYVPLNDSKVINSYMEQCFDYVADEMKSPSGEIWMLPLTLNGDAIWYVPENTEKFEVDLEEFRYLDSFMDLASRMPDAGSYGAYVDYPGDLGYFLHEQYDMTYNNYTNKKIDFETPLYKEIFDKTWTGWINYSSLPRHPLFRSSREEDNYGMAWESTLYDKSKVIFKIDGINGHLNTAKTSLDGWRALPLPHISSEVEGNKVTMLCAFINPYSQNKELALEYLEAITQVPFNFNGSYLGTFLFQDKTMYENYYDINSPAFEDIYNIIQNGVIGEPRYSLNGNIIDDYQNGRLSLDEAIAAIQREAQMWANE